MAPIKIVQFLCFLLIVSTAQGQTESSVGPSQNSGSTQYIGGLPANAIVIESRRVSAKHPNRQLVLWMVHPKRNPRDTSDDIYTCPEYTRGSYYSGPTRVSLYDSSTHRIINTIKIVASDSDNTDSFDIPYKIRRGYYYRVRGQGSSTREGKPNLIWLRDYNGDGKALEFALFDAPACMGLQTTLIGYNESEDLVIQYPLRLQILENGELTNQTLVWADYLFSKKPLRPGHWKYDVDYRGRGGSLDKWDVKYNSAKAEFEGTVNRIVDEP